MQLTTRTRLNAPVEEFTFLMAQQGKYFRTLFNLFYWNNRPNWKTVCSIDYLFQNGYSFGTKYANSLYLEARAKAKLHQEERAFRQLTLQDRLRELQKKKKKLHNLLSATNNKTLYLKTKRDLYWINRKIEKISFKDNGVTFGTKALQRKLSRKQSSKQHWLNARNNFIYAIGRSERLTGNDCIHYIQKDETVVKIELERTLYQENGQIKTKDKKFVETLIESHYFIEELNTIHKKTHRIMLRKKKLELHTTLEKEKVIEPTDRRLGVDFNHGFLAYYENEQQQGSISFLIEGNHQQRKESLRQAIKQLLKLSHADIVIEDLNFNRTKNKLFPAQTKQGKGYNRMLSNLSYSQYQKLMEVECFKADRFLKTVDPKNTSKQAIKNGWDRHIGAARIIKNL